MMTRDKRILVITVAAWNSKVGANSWASLLENYDSKNVANLCIREETPDSKVCSRYFAISENKIIKSILNRKIKTGAEVERAVLSENKKDLEEHNKRYAKMKKNRRYSMLLARELIWKAGNWKTKELDNFLDDFKPDVILHSMEGYIHLNRIIEYAVKRTGAAAIGYVWDDNFTYKQSDQVGYRIYRFFQRKSLKRLAKKTSEFFAISTMAKKEADEFFGINCHLLTKPLNAMPVVSYDKIGDCIKLLYTGNLYIGRDKSLLQVVNAIKKFPRGKFFVDVYTKSHLEQEYLDQIDPEICCIHPPVSQSEVLKKQKETDILLFLEAIDGPDAKVARLSFSTKITDYLSAGKCIFAVGNKDTAPMQYFIENDAAVVCGSDDEIMNGFEKIHTNPHIICEYAENAALSAERNHNPEHIRDVFDSAVVSAINKNRKRI